MNDFAKNYKARYESGSKIIRDCCDDPLEVYVHMGFKEVIFKLGYLSDHNIAYSEPASGHCYGFGGLCNYRFDVELVTTTWKEILAFLQQMVFEI